MSTSDTRPLVVGAGPVGKAAALFLARAGVRPRVVERAAEPSPYSKALAINPRTLELLEPAGVTDKLLALGLRIGGACVWRRGKTIANLTFGGRVHRYPFMLALSQAVTERVLEQALVAQGVEVERGIALSDCRLLAEEVEATLHAQAGGSSHIARVPWLLAADGAHSTVRHALGLDFPGSDFERPWHLVDVPLDTTLEPDRAHVIFADGGGFIFLIRVVTDQARETSSAEAPLWRLISDRPSPVQRVPMAQPAGPPVWTSSFHIAHRIVDRMRVGQVFLAGDAAHIHSPIGARGMNLGIEDAWVLAQCVQAGRADAYDPQRRRVDGRVVRRVEQFSKIVLGESFIAGRLRGILPATLTRIPRVRDQLVKTIIGLDHPLPPATS